VQYNYIGKTCPFCQYAIKSERDAVLCPACKVPHHRECWQENGGCTTFGCKETIFRAPAQNRVEITLGATANDQVAVRHGGSNTFIVAALIISLFVIIMLAFKLTTDSPVRDTSPPPPQQTTQQDAQQDVQQDTDQITQQEEEVIYYVITEQGYNLYIRKSPGRDNKKSSDIITKVPRGTQLKVIDNHTNSIKKDGFTWWEIRVVQSGIMGWVAAEYISTNRSDVKK
jgi:hypothetical protein